MNRKHIVLISALLSMTNLCASTVDSLEQTELEKLQSKIDSLEVKIERLAIIKNNNTVLARGEYLNWGKGLTIAADLPDPLVEIGYTFHLINNRLRFGCLAGYSYLNKPDKNKKPWPDIDWKGKANNYVHLKLQIATPVFMNFMSLCASVAPMYVIDSPFLDGAVENEASFTIFRSCAELEFWVSPAMCISVGLTHNNYSLWISAQGKWESSDWYDDTFKTGLKYFFAPRKQKNRHP